MSWIILAWLLTSCASRPLIDAGLPTVPEEAGQTGEPQRRPEPEYRIQVGDRLAVRSYYDQQLNQEVLVRRDGRISLVLLQDVDVFNRTPAEVGSLISQEYRKLLADAAPVTVSVMESKGLSIYVGGEVRNAAQQSLNGPLTVVQALTAAGGTLATANTRQVLVLRHQDDGRFLAYQIDVEKVLVNEASDVYLQRSDIVHVPMSKIARVDKFVSQYLSQIVPDWLSFDVNYSWVDQVGGDNRVEVINR